MAAPRFTLPNVAASCAAPWPGSISRTIRTGKPKTDKLNPDPAKRSRPLIGLQGLAPTGPDKWSEQIYNADDGHTYQASLTVPGGNAARVEGCVLAVLCKGQTWTRAN